MKPGAYGPFKFSLIDRRPRLALPGNARVALWVILNVEFYPLDAAMPGDSGERPPQGKDVTPQVRQWSQRDYGNRVGFVRLRDLLTRHGIPATVALNSEVCDHHPEIVSDCVKLGWEMMGHCRVNTERVSDVPRDQERRMIGDALKRIQAATGQRPVGWLGAGLDETWNTLEHLADEGCTYVADWVNDDQPYTMDLNGKSIVSVPYTYELNDIPALVRHKYTPVEFERMIKDQFDVLYAEGEKSGRVMAIALHPFLFGQPHRMPALERAFQHIDRFAGVWKTTGAEIAKHHLASKG
jgi:peptidoglycan/xylan/chitin deacetylase (PgdA/CDA1 family)